MLTAIKRPNLTRLTAAALAPIVEIQRNLPRLQEIKNIGASLKIAQEAYTGGGNSQIFKGVLNGREVVCKKTLITSDMYERLKEREEIFERMHAGLGMNRRGILMPILRCVDAFAQVINGGHGYYWEIYSRCIPFNIPEDPKRQLTYIKIIAAALLNLHTLQIAHMDLKHLNFMFESNDSMGAKPTPVIIDWGEARCMDANRDLPIVTSVGLIQRSSVIRAILADPWIDEKTFANLLIGMTPPNLYYLIDRIMFGIFISGSFAPFIHMKKLGDRLVSSSIAELAKYWRSLGKSDALSIHLKIFKDGSLPDDWGDYTLERFLHDLNFDFSRL